jgi:monofunctional chorismate mutase
MELNEIRKKIDEIDEKIIELLARRFELTSEIGFLKAGQGIEAVSPEREALQFQRFEKLAKELELSYPMVEGIFRQIIDQVVRDHETINKKLMTESDA